MHSSTVPGSISNMFRAIMSQIDFVIYSVLAIIFTIFMNVATAELFSSELVTNMFRRIEIIIGVYMVFRVTISLLSGIVSPDGVMSGKDEKGVTKLVQRIAVTLIMLVLIMPIQIPNVNNDWERQINNHGILFGTLYSLQNSIIENNTIGKIILGLPNDQSADLDDSMYNLGEMFSINVLQSFIVPNLTAEAADSEEDWTELIEKPENWACPKEGYDKTYEDGYANPPSIGVILSLGAMQCRVDSPSFLSLISFEILGNSGKAYVYYYMPVFPTIIGILFIFAVGAMTLDVAIRVLKLGILRMLAPIPIISYIDPKSAKDGAFASWTRNLLLTYLDLFIRLAAIFFVLFFIQELMRGNIGLNIKGGFFLSAITRIIIYISLFFFLKQAPKFFKDMLGLKGTGGLGIGLSGLLGGTASLVGGGGLSGFASGALESMNTANRAAAEGKEAPSPWYTQAKKQAQIRTGNKDAEPGPIGWLRNRSDYANREKVANRLGYGKTHLANAEAEQSKLKTALSQSNANLSQLDNELKNYENVNTATPAFVEPERRANESDQEFYQRRAESMSASLRAKEKRDLLERRATEVKRNENLSYVSSKMDSYVKALEQDRNQAGLSPNIAGKYKAKGNYTTALEYNESVDRYQRDSPTSVQDILGKLNEYGRSGYAGGSSGDTDSATRMTDDSVYRG